MPWHQVAQDRQQWKALQFEVARRATRTQRRRKAARAPQSHGAIGTVARQLRPWWLHARETMARACAGHAQRFSWTSAQSAQGKGETCCDMSCALLLLGGEPEDSTGRRLACDAFSGVSGWCMGRERIGARPRCSLWRLRTSLFVALSMPTFAAPGICADRSSSGVAQCRNGRVLAPLIS